MDNPIYLIDRATFEGQAVSILNPETCCSIFNPGKTIAELIEEHKVQDPDIVGIDELTQLMEGLATPWREQDEEQFYELYECLPPARVFNATLEDGTKLFGYMSPEATVSFLYAHGLRIIRNGKVVYLCALKSMYDSWEQLAKEAMECLTKNE